MKSTSSRWSRPFSVLLGIGVWLAGTQSLLAQAFLIGGFGDGIYASRLHKDGAMDAPTLVAKQQLPAFFAFHPKLNILYAVTESMRNDSKHPACVTAYRFNADDIHAGKTPSLESFSTERIDGDIPCHVAVDPRGEYLSVANYTSGSLVLFPLAQDGSIQPASDVVQHEGKGPNPNRQEGPHAHCTVWDPSQKYLLACDLGLDKVLVYEVDRSNHKLKRAKNPWLSTAGGSGPRHLAFHPNDRWVYVVNELNMTLTAAAWDSTQGKLTEMQTLGTLPADAKGDDFSTAEVLVHPTGRFVYSSNRGHHSIATFRVDESTGKLTFLGVASTGGKTPRNFRISPDGQFLLAENQQSDSVLSFRIDPQSGGLTATGHRVTAPAPACIKFFDR